MKHLFKPTSNKFTVTLKFIYHANGKLFHRDTCSMEKSAIKAHHGPLRRHGQCNDLNVLCCKNE